MCCEEYPLVSVVIPTHNRACLVTQAIDSILSQDYPNKELIVVDDGSTDGTASIIQSRYPNIQLLQTSNCGVSAARNQGIKQAKGEWIALLDSDDRWQPEKLSKQLQFLLAHPSYRICHTDETWYRNHQFVNPMNKHKKPAGWIFSACVDMCLISPSSVCIHRSLFKELGLFDETLPACEDYDLWLRITSNYPVLYLDEKLTVKYGGHSDQLSKRYWGMDRFRIRALQKIIDTDQLDRHNRNFAIKALRQKVYVYLKGARKRNKTQEVSYYEALLSNYNER